MKQLVLVLASVICLCYTTKSFAQSYNEEVEESIILDDKNNESETTIEIKNGKLFVDGKKVSDIDKSTKVKIVKKNTLTENNNFSFDQFDKPLRRSFGMNSNRPMLGVLTENANPGAKINKVVEGSAADKAGLQQGDIITAIDGKNIQSYEDLVATISEYDKGDKIEIEAYRNEELKTMSATLEAGEPKNWLGQNDNRYQIPPIKDLSEFFLSPNTKMHFNLESNNAPKIGLEIEESEDGLEVMSVKPNSAADKAGIKKGDEIKTVEGNKISTLNQLKREIADNKDNKEIYFGVKRQGAIKSLPVVLPRAKKRAQF